MRTIIYNNKIRLDGPFYGRTLYEYMKYGADVYNVEGTLEYDADAYALQMIFKY